MMTPIRKLLAGLACTAALAPMSTLAAPQLTLSGPASVAAGGTVQIDVLASEVSDLYAFQFDIVFDGTRFSVAGVSEGSWLATAGSSFFDAGTVDAPAGRVEFVLGTLIGPVAGVSGSGSLAQLSFLAAPGAVGSGTFQLANVLAFDSSLNPIEVGLQGITVAVPEPSTLWTMLAGLAVGAGWVAKRRKPGLGDPRMVVQQPA